MRSLKTPRFNKIASTRVIEICTYQTCRINCFNGIRLAAARAIKRGNNNIESEQVLLMLPRERQSLAGIRFHYGRVDEMKRSHETI